ncbi:unnamed protein product [Brugia timori]|uniref:Uncharacterized protein n=1 Tax=Brugia timori TaxID=42155 RepID=A0A3P7U7X0_9BILA|nr:unnamed protein product [Brugia timori]
MKKRRTPSYYLGASNNCLNFDIPRIELFIFDHFCLIFEECTLGHDRLGMIRRQVFHLSLRAKQKANYTSNRECKSSRNTITDFPDDDSNEPLSHFVDECCMDENELSRNGKHFKRDAIEGIHARTKE